MRALGESSVAKGDESVGTPCGPPRMVDRVTSGGEEPDVMVDGGTNVVGDRAGGGGGSDGLARVLLLLEEEDCVVLVVVLVSLVCVGTGKGRLDVLVVILGSFAMRLLAVFFASSISFFGMAFLSASHPPLTGSRKRLSTPRRSSLQ